MAPSGGDTPPVGVSPDAGAAGGETAGRATAPCAPSLSEADRARALARFTVVRPALEEGVAPAVIARAQGVTPRAIQRWLARYRRDGLAGLARPARSARGRSRLDPTLRQFIEGLALRPQQRSVATLRRRAVAVAAERAAVVEALTAARRAESSSPVGPEPPPVGRPTAPRLKRYVNE